MLPKGNRIQLTMPACALHLSTVQTGQAGADREN